jgi:hypothetical protein
MGKRSNLYEIYFGPADSKLGQGYGQIKNGPLGSQRNLGGNYGIYDEPDRYDVEDVEDEEVDIRSKIDGDIPFTDTGMKANRYSSYTGAYTNLTEDGQHTTTAVKGISPNLSYRGSKGQKVTKTSMSSTSYPKIYNRPRVDMTATQYGTSRAPLPRHYEQDKNVWSLEDMLDSHEQSLYKHQNNINRVKKLINEIKLNFL